MKIQLASDLHLDMLGAAKNTWTIIRPEPDADLLVLAGDIDTAANALTRFKDWPVPILYTPGNHEFYDHDWPTVRAELLAQSKRSRIHVLDNRRLDIGRVKFLGCTLWTDFALPGRTQEEWMRKARTMMNDFHLIGNLTGTFMPADASTDHQHSKAWLSRELLEPHDGPTVVITHHAPHPNSIHPKYADDPLNAAFASDLTPLLMHADLWLHGHVHDSFDYDHEGCRVVANPAGYALNRRQANREEQLRFENLAFLPDLVIDLPGA